ncbi:MAG: glycerol-3-phosphate 1-O-acyltransferase PlsY [Candidatus Marinimicrobia bacterium]|jgi:glycerol-3-phosphate acyltransferase PlsY|nr:glycerol-3-phosphate 1-O-acyltransferase PlsY [Candidatus Neomarinimicrobiota bacterium]MBT3691736.1 glycerol-3-phosphate 1-O-acyltransferase PlsY [Candidatus Neomarinimicrobiota bacterium]MBT3732671.1 glycerol-3-phosphate 1-O-acyltransferase PlsY [Candidatus Neomarinimicrobiota bacterium]MBT4143984.1 glycerol-3-phosphate 1-O-acyltransferase PlsY [Candidatus Neomarinimicrobiota bacterium]MBT4177999.1 glycerol-3-phosphate 1-O-acyltransferase PlsY [Candidatus Neomarinimicrobiota bacterium]
MAILWILFIGAYLVGSFPTSILAGKLLKQIDIREHGSGNAGATNVYRVLGWKPAIIVLLIDGLKGWIAVKWIAVAGFESQAIPDLGALQILCGIGAILGHTYSIFAQFRGGKGIGTLAGVLIGLFPIAFPMALAVFIMTLISTGFVSLSSLLAATSLPIILLGIFPFFDTINPPLSLLVFSLLIPWFVIFTHRHNISRLKDGTEARFDRVMIFKKN